MSVDPDPEKQRCQGILDATGAAGADMGGKVNISTVPDCSTYPNLFR